MLYTIIVILLILWLLGAFGGNLGLNVPAGNAVHFLIVLVVILLILRLLGVV